MIRRLYASAALAALFLGSVAFSQVQPSPQSPPVPPPQVPSASPAGVAVSPPAPVVKSKKVFPRGARPTPLWKIFASPRHVARAAPATFVPAIIPTPAQMSYWGNSQYGDCVTAEEFFAKCVYPIWFSATGKMLDMPESLAIQWARQNGYLNGANLPDVMDSMKSVGVTYNGTTYTDGGYQAVDFTSWATLTSAISQGPVKIGVASGQFDNVAGVGEQNGWIMVGLRPDQNEDHCVSLCGYGTMQQLATAMGISLPSGVNGSSNGLLLFTWDTIGLIDFNSMQAITAEAWLRSPTTPQTVPPQPGPPPPTPGTFTYTLGPGAPAGAAIDAAGNFTWAIPPSQAPGTIQITFSASSGGQSATGSFTINVTASTGAIVIAPIPPQSAAIGSTFQLGLGQYVSQGVGSPAAKH